MTCLSFPCLSGKLIDLRELTMDDAITIVNLMDYEIAKIFIKFHILIE